ncbi:MAG: indole-3-glycerol phosphate synthase [Anaerophaga sp.]|uniref:indole-3-glycerol phosphate synthase TrpC n=1 Tax=Anaerophaga thermohalophila TaxID=177400 RepID=UPI000237CDBC|nr:indole-3-glycerol phosphate synthase TrpC [Anaerophaga thermohalophila]MDN5290250.1 indole-3-glycerol phosphate synthase [Anaerophaga sp.]
MNILDKIVAHKKEELKAIKQKVSVKELEYYRHFSIPVPSLKQSLTDNPDFPVIAEFKRRSPSKGDINADAKLKDVIPDYQKAGVAGISVLTDHHFFGGSSEDLSSARDLTSLPVIRKEFIIDPYQVYEARAIGASAILLIAAILEKEQARDLAALANYLGMEVLMELHDEQETEKINTYVDMVGINNRNLKTFEVNLEHAARLASSLPEDILPIAESGIHSTGDILFLKDAGFRGFLMGEYFMKHKNPGQACMKLKKELIQKQLNRA